MNGRAYSSLEYSVLLAELARRIEKEMRLSCGSIFFPNQRMISDQERFGSPRRIKSAAAEEMQSNHAGQ